MTIPLSDLRVGHTLLAGMSKSTILAEIDFETRSAAGFVWSHTENKFIETGGLPAVGQSVYSEHPSTEVICMAYNLKDGFGSRRWKPGDEIPLDLFFHLQDGGLLEAWNVSFEFYIWNNVCTRLYLFPPLRIEQLRCAAAKARGHALPGHLDSCGGVLDIANKKLADGKRLIRKYCCPHKPSKAHPGIWHNLQDNPEDWILMQKYNDQDILAEAEISSRVPDLSLTELLVWKADQIINRRGVRLDRVAIDNCIAIIEKAYKKYNAGLKYLTNGAATRASQTARIKKWIEGYGITVTSLDKEHMEELLKLDLPPIVREVIKIKQLIGSAAVKKLYSMVDHLSRDGRVRDLFVYHAARTGRWGGDSVQPQNLPNSAGVTTWLCTHCGKHARYDRSFYCLWCSEQSFAERQVEWSPSAIEDALSIIASRSLPAVEMYFGEAVATIASCLRGMFIPAEGHDFISSDYSAIEGVCIAELAGEEWQQEVYRTHGMIYEATASQITKKYLEEYIQHKQETGKHHPDRRLGKIASLASQYGGWIGAWTNFHADEFLTEEEMKTAILAWRAASPMIVRLWRETEYCAHMATQNPNLEFNYREVSFERRGDVLYCKLPSGRYITYHRPQLAPSTRRPGTMELSYEGWNTNPKNGAPGWIRMTTYGARIVENITQSVARDILAHAIVNLEAVGYPIVLHVHDEVVCEMPEGQGSVAELERIMMDLPEWAKGWPIKATGGWRAKRYQK